MPQSYEKNFADPYFFLSFADISLSYRRTAGLPSAFIRHDTTRHTYSIHRPGAPRQLGVAGSYRFSGSLIPVPRRGPQDSEASSAFRELRLAAWRQNRYLRTQFRTMGNCRFGVADLRCGGGSYSSRFQG